MNDLFLDEIVRPDAHGSGGGGGGRSARRTQRAERDRKRRRRRRKNLVAFLIVVLVLGGGGFAVWKLGLPMLDSIGSGSSGGGGDYPGPGTGSVDVTIPEGATGSAMAEILAEADVVKGASAFRDAFSANAQAPSIQPGTYRMRLQMRAADAVAALLDPTYRVQTQVTIPEGKRLSQILEILAGKTTVPAADFQALLADPAALGLPAEAGGNAEGWLFPATYTFEPGMAPADMLKTMIAKTIEVLDSKAVPADQREVVLIKASLVEKESPGGDVSPQIARAIENRLADDMKLDIDSAVLYGLNTTGGLTDEGKAQDTPYNLYMHVGLPPTPIASSGEESINAVLAPADGPWKYWCTINLETKETRMAVTLDEHKVNVALLRQWEAEHPSDG